MSGTQGEPPCGVLIRPAVSDDAERVRRFLTGLSLHTQTLRFFAGVSRPAASLVRALIEVNETRDALVAVLEGEVVGHAMSYRGGQTDVEIAVVVADQWQGFGLGPALIDTLLARATVRGASTVGMDVLGDNRKVLGMIRRIWPGAQMKVSAGSVEVTAMIREAQIFAEQGSGGSPLTV
ncbi:GNAT family N-acetyltransferase [Nonomuraea sp. NPDC049486]|uniref:GNAT family N-acetyltransferase n=1 Tax=Nonomuraea harbinensis TaxID=1286938 RepID=A0ABW1C8H1_9ACTN|nr:MULTISPECIES: GNAT family N-acetyltransferase [Nonomuraea]TXK34993.1 GNAT family N-acetyltransferase [Nonomuraea sp. C10]